MRHFSLDADAAVRILSNEIPNFMPDLLAEAGGSAFDIWAIALAVPGDMVFTATESVSPVRLGVPNAVLPSGQTRYEVWHAALLAVTTLMGDPEARYRTGYSVAELQDATKKFFDPATLPSIELECRRLSGYPVPDDLKAAPLWENYLVAQAVQASLGLIPRNALTMAIIPIGLEVKFYFEVSQLTSEDEQDIFDIVDKFGDITGEVTTQSTQIEVIPHRSGHFPEGARLIYLGHA